MAKKNKSLDILEEMGDLTLSSPSSPFEKPKEENLGERRTSAPPPKQDETVHVPKPDVIEPPKVQQVKTPTVESIRDLPRITSLQGFVDESRGEAYESVHVPQAEMSKLDEWFRAAKEHANGGNSVHVILDELTIKRLSWIENAVGLKNTRASRKLVIATVVDYFWASFGKEIEKVNERKLREDLREMKGR